MSQLQVSPSFSNSPKTELVQLLAWVMVAVVPIISYFGLLSIESDTYALDNRQALFLAMVSSAVVMWALRLVPDFVPGLTLLILVTLLELVPQSVAFSGFVSEIFFLVLGVFILAGLLAESNWLKYLESIAFSRSQSMLLRGFSIIGMGFMLTLIVPSPLGRSSMVFPVLNQFLKPETKRSNTLLSLIHIHAATLLSTVFLTGNPLNFILLSMLEQQTQNRFQWLGWLQAASISCFIFTIALVLFFVVALKVYPNTQVFEQPQTETVVKLGYKELGTAILYGLLFLAVLTRSIHQIPLVWLIMGLALLVFYFSGMSLHSVRHRIDWPTLIFIATVVAWGPILELLNLNQWLVSLASFLIPIFERDLILGILGTSALIMVIRIFIPGAPAFLLLAATLIPFAMSEQSMTISPWLIGFIVVTLSEGFIFPYQHGVPSQVLSSLDDANISYSLYGIIMGNICFCLIRLGAIIASIPLWHSMNLI